MTADTARALWDEARELAATAEREADHPALRRALVMCAIAGSADDAEGFQALLADVFRAARRLAFADPQPLFDAAAALVATDDVAAREAIVLAPSRFEREAKVPNPRTAYDDLRPR